VPDQLIPTLLIAALVLVAFAGMAAGWRARRRRQAHLPPVAPLPAEPGEPSLTIEALYVATTLRDDPLERVAVRGLGMRAKATVQVLPGGLALALAGQDAVFLPAADLNGAGRATYAIDRVVERDGLVAVAWTLGDTPLDTYLRPSSSTDGTALVDAIQRIARRSVASTTDPTEREN
jgi:hypothetical protein